MSTGKLNLNEAVESNDPVVATIDEDINEPWTTETEIESDLAEPQIDVGGKQLDEIEATVCTEDMVLTMFVKGTKLMEVVEESGNKLTLDGKL